MATDNLHAGKETLPRFLDEIDHLLTQVNGIVGLLAGSLSDFESDAAWAANTLLDEVREKIKQHRASHVGSAA